MTAILLSLGRTASAGPETSMRELASGQVKKGVRTIGMGGDGAPLWPLIALAIRLDAEYRFGEADEAHTLVGRPHQQPPEQAVGEGGANDLALPTPSCRAGRHAQQCPGLLVHPAFRAKP